MRRVLLVVAVLLVALGGGLYVFVVRPLLAPAEPTVTAEAALATPELIVLGGVNVKQAAFLERWFLGAPVIQVAHETSEHAPLERTLLDHLRVAGIDVRRDLEYVLYGLYPSDGVGLRQAVVLVGRFDPGSINDYLARELKAAARPAAGGRASYELTIIDPADCKPTRTWVVTADPRWVLMADPASHAVLLPRLASAQSGAPDALAWWRSLARSDVVSVGLWAVKDAEKALAQPLMKGSAKALSTEAEAVEHFYLGLGARTVPPQGRFRIVVDAADAGRVSQKITGWQQALSQSKAAWAERAPTVAALFDSLAIRTAGTRSTIEFTVDRTLATNAQRVVNELLSALLGGFGVKRPAPEAGQRAEQIDRSPVVFEAVAPASALKPYDPVANFAEDVDQVQGPFGLRIDEIRVGSKPEVGLEIAIGGFAGAVPNITNDGQRARLFIDSVKSVEGEVLRSEACGQERNYEPASFTTSIPGRLKATKVLRLIPGADPHKLQSVSGRVELRLPARTETVGLAHPAPGAKLERNGATFVITKVAGGSVSYQIMGAREKVLHFRALNAAGQPLASDMAFSTDFLLGAGTAGQKDYVGVVDRVEVVFAAEEEAVRLPFTLTNFALTSKPPTVALDRTPPFQPYGYQAWRREQQRLPASDKPDALGLARVDPFELAFDKIEAYFAWNTKLDLTFRSPVLPNFEKAFTVGRLRLARIELKDGTALEPPPPGATGDRPKPGVAWDVPISFGSAPKDGALTKQLRLFVEVKAKPEEVKALRGVLAVHFPRALQTLRLDDLSPGQRADLGDFSVTVTSRSRKGLTLVANRDGHRLLYVRFVNAEGQAVAFFSPDITESPDGSWRFELSPLGTPVRAEVIVASELDRKEYPFTLAVKR